MRSSLIEILDLDLKIHVVDIGASYIEGEGDAIYKNLLKSGNALVVGFEPDPDAINELNKSKNPHELYLPYAIADGNRHTLNICQAPGMSSILEPNDELLNCFHGFPAWGKIIRRVPLDTRRLDDVGEIEEIDFLKIDIQGAELMALENATEKLRKCLVIQTEVEFLPMYKNQPLFGDVFNFLVGQGFHFHTFQQIAKRMVVPLAKPNDLYAGINQGLWADAVFIRNFATPAKSMTMEGMLKYSVILHDLYGSFDVVLRTLFALDHNFQTDYAGKYMRFLDRK